MTCPCVSGSSRSSSSASSSASTISERSRALEPPERAWPARARRRHQRQRFGHGDGRVRPARGRPSHRPLHVAASRPHRRAYRHRRRAGDAGRFDVAAADVLDVVDGFARAGALARHADVLRGDDGDGVRDLPPRRRRRRRSIEVGLGGRFDATNVIAPVSARSPRSRSTTSGISATRSPRSPSRRPASSSPALPLIVGDAAGSARSR